MTEDKIKYILSLFQGELDKYSSDDEYKAYLYEKINKAYKIGVEKGIEKEKFIEIIKKEIPYFIDEYDRLKENVPLISSKQNTMIGTSINFELVDLFKISKECNSSEEYPDFHIEEGLNLDGISIYPHNNTNDEDYPDTLVVGDETYNKEDLIKVANQYGDYYLLQDYLRKDGFTDISLIKSTNSSIELYTENDGKIWIAKNNGIFLLNKIEKNNIYKI